MRGSEGGIPYKVPAKKLTVHLRGMDNMPACKVQPWRFQTTTNPEHVTCSRCKETT